MEKDKYRGGLDKGERILLLYRRLQKGEILKKVTIGTEFNITERTVQRDIDVLRNVLYEEGALEEIVTLPRGGGYQLIQRDDKRLSPGELLAVGKILLDSRGLSKATVSSILTKLYATQMGEIQKKEVEELLRNELHYYVEPRHQKDLLPLITELGKAIREKRYVTIRYLRNQDKTDVERLLKPVGICFSEYYFYLVGFIDDASLQENFDVPNDIFPTIYRIDRIQNITVEKERFRDIDYHRRFNEGEFKKRIQFMFGGRLQKIQFTYTGSDVEAIQDRLPTATILSADESKQEYRIEAEVFGEGIHRWLRSQGEAVKDVDFK